MSPPPRLHVLTATRSDRAVIFRRGPSGEVACLMWDRSANSLELGQWLKGRIHEYRSDLSPDGSHLVYFACRGGRCWTAVSRVPWLRAVAYWPQPDSWHGGGAFTDDGALWLNGAAAPDDLPDRLRAASPQAFPHSTDGFHMGALYAVMMQRRGWVVASGDRYETELRKPLAGDWTLQMRIALGEEGRALISSRYALIGPEGAEQTDWEWAEPHGDALHFAREGAIWSARLTGAGGLEDRQLLHDLSDMRFQAVEAPYRGIQEGSTA